MSRTAGLARKVRVELERRSSAEFAKNLQWFFQGAVDAYGVRGADFRDIARQVYREIKPWPAEERIRFAEALWKTGKLEAAAVVIHAWRRFAREFTAAEFRLFERWLDNYVTNWSSCDGLSAWLLGACVANDPKLIPKLMRWAASPNRWKRRAAAVSLLPHAKAGTSTAEIFELVSRLRNERDEMVLKGIGWLLKETYPRRPREAVEFLERWPDAPRLVVRYAAEKMTPADRAKFGLKSLEVLVRGR